MNFSDCFITSCSAFGKMVFFSLYSVVSINYLRIIYQSIYFLLINVFCIVKIYIHEKKKQCHTDLEK